MSSPGLKEQILETFILAFEQVVHRAQILYYVMLVEWKRETTGLGAIANLSKPHLSLKYYLFLNFIL